MTDSRHERRSDTNDTKLSQTSGEIFFENHVLTSLREYRIVIEH